MSSLRAVTMGGGPPFSRPGPGACYAQHLLMRSLITMVASLGLLAGCADAAMVVPPQALPALAESKVLVYERTLDGERVVERVPLRGVVVEGLPRATTKEASDRHPTHLEWFRAPFEAKLSGDELELANGELRSRYALGSIKELQLHYDAHADDPRRGMRIAGSVLVSLALASFATGIALAVEAAKSSGGAAFLVEVPPLTLGGLLAGIGIPLWAVGVSPTKPDLASLPATVPTLVPVSKGAALRWAF